MESPEDIEKALGRLAPAAISERGQRALEGTIDGLSSAAPVALSVRAMPRSGWWTAAVAIPTAAAAALTVALLMKGSPVDQQQVAVTLPPAAHGTAELMTTAPVTNPLRQDTDSELPGDVPVINLFADQHMAFINLRSGKLTLSMKGNGEVFRIEPRDGGPAYEGALEDPNFPSSWKSPAKRLQRSLQGAGESLK